MIASSVSGSHTHAPKSVGARKEEHRVSEQEEVGEQEGEEQEKRERKREGRGITLVLYLILCVYKITDCRLQTAAGRAITCSHCSIMLHERS